jgi:predicted AlkP superfamily phosphohydrolase/phosphomutase
MRMRAVLFLILLAAVVVGAWRLAPLVLHPSEVTPIGPLLVIAVDGADWQYVDPLIERGELPAFARLRREGSWGTLESLRGRIMSPVVWTTVATGKGPMEHGIRSFTVPDPETGEDTQVTSTLRRCPAFWNILSDRGRRVAVVGWSVTWPVEPVNGVMVSSFLPFAPPDAGPGFSRIVFPDSLTGEELAARTLPPDPGDPALFPFVGSLPESDLTDDERSALNVLRWSLAVDETFVDLAIPRLQGGFDVTAVFLGSVDKLGHPFMRYKDPAGCEFHPRPQVADAFSGVVDQAYRYVDRQIGRLLDAAPPGTIVLVLSDHGFHSIPVRDAPLGWEWHRRQGIYALWGKDVRAGVHLPEANVFDILPTILFAEGLPQAEDMRGKPIVRAFDEEVAERRQPGPVATYQTADWEVATREFVKTPEGEAELDLLRSLGYIR